MCCVGNPEAKKRFLKSLGRRKTFVAWKALRDDGRSRVNGYQYSPGHHRLIKPLQRYGGARGFHFYMHKPKEGRPGCVIVPVIVRRDDLLAIEYMDEVWSRDMPQGVANGITIRKRDWDAAFGKPTKRRR